MPLRHTISAGLVDASCASIATLAIGFYAAYRLDPATLGWYAIYFAAFVAAAVVPKQLVFLPAEVESLAGERPTRLALLPQSIRAGALAALLAAALAALAAALVAGRAAASARAALTVTCFGCSLLSPLQDHVRRMFHLSGYPWTAASMSVVLLAGVGGALALLLFAGVPPVWIPLGALTLANLVSLAAAVFFARRRWQGRPPAVRWSPLLRKGLWLLPVGLLPSGTAFVVAALVAALAGAATVGYAEAARVIGRPVLVLTMGLAAALRPRSLEAARANRLSEARGISRVFTIFTCVAGGAYLALAGVAWTGNPLARLLPHAYTIAGLAAASIVAHMADGVTLPYRFEMLGKQRERTLLHIEILGNACRLALVAATGWARAFVIPAGLAVLALLRWLGYGRVLRAEYRKS